MTSLPTDLVLPDFDPARIAQAIEDNAVAGVEAWDLWPDIQLQRNSSLTWLISDIPFFIFNSVVRSKATPENIDSEIDQIIARGRSRNVPLAWWVTSLSQPGDLSQRLESKGFVHITDLPAMAVDLSQLNESSPMPSGVTIDQIMDRASFDSWSRVSALGNEFPDFVEEAWREIHWAMGLGEGLPWTHFLAKLDGGPVAVCTLVLNAGVAGIQGVATVPEARRRGIGSAITLEALKYAYSLGYRVGTLFSSEMGMGVYRNLGFREYFKGHLYVWEDD